MIMTNAKGSKTSIDSDLFIRVIYPGYAPVGTHLMQRSVEGIFCKCNTCLMCIMNYL